MMGVPWRLRFTLLLAVLLVASPRPNGVTAAQEEPAGATFAFYLDFPVAVPAYAGPCPPAATWCGELFEVELTPVAGPTQLGPEDLAFCAGPFSRSPAPPIPDATISPCFGPNSFAVGKSNVGGYQRGQTIHYRYVRLSGPFERDGDRWRPLNPPEYGPEGTLVLADGLTVHVSYTFPPGSGWSQATIKGEEAAIPAGLPSTGDGIRGASPLAIGLPLAGGLLALVAGLARRRGARRS